MSVNRTVSFEVEVRVEQPEYILDKNTIVLLAPLLKLDCIVMEDLCCQRDRHVLERVWRLKLLGAHRGYLVYLLLKLRIQSQTIPRGRK